MRTLTFDLYSPEAAIPGVLYARAAEDASDWYDLARCAPDGTTLVCMVDGRVIATEIQARMPDGSGTLERHFPAGMVVLVFEPGELPTLPPNGSVWVDGAFQSPPLPVPASISDRQFAHELRARGLITQAEALDFVRQGIVPPALQAIIDALPSQGERDDAELIVSGATLFERSHPLTSAFAQAFGWSAIDTDDFFRAAAAR